MELITSNMGKYLYLLHMTSKSAAYGVVLQCYDIAVSIMTMHTKAELTILYVCCLKE